MKTHLFADYYVEETTPEVWQSFVNENQSTVFTEEDSIPFDSFFNKEEKVKLAMLKANMAMSLQFYFLIFENEKPIGWHFGFQRSELEYFMANTGILPQYQRKGIYSAFLKFALAKILDEGFQFITSIHRPDNNAVLIPKLKAGFFIQASGFLIQTMILESNCGMMLQVVYLAKAIYRPMFDSSLGIKTLNEQISKLM